MDSEEIPQAQALLETIARSATLAAIAELIKSLPEGRERGYAVEACVALCYRLWGWNVERFRDELLLLEHSNQ